MESQPVEVRIENKQGSYDYRELCAWLLERMSPGQLRAAYAELNKIFVSPLGK